MIPCDWIGMVTIRSDTRWTWSTNGTITMTPGPRAPSLTLPSRNCTPRSYCFSIRTDATKPTTTITPTTTRAITAVMMLPSIDRQTRQRVIAGDVVGRMAGGRPRAGSDRSVDARLGWTGTPRVAPDGLIRRIPGCFCRCCAVSARVPGVPCLRKLTPDPVLYLTSYRSLLFLVTRADLSSCDTSHVAEG